MEVLSYFGETSAVAICRYESFVMEAACIGHREEFGGGGMRRSSAFLEIPIGKEAFDERVLGCGQFVEDMWSEQDESHEPLPSLESVLKAVADHYEVSFEQLRHPNKTRKVSSARAAACFVAERFFGYSGVGIAHILNITSSGVAVAARRGEELIGKNIGELLRNLKISATSPPGGED